MSLARMTLLRKYQALVVVYLLLYFVWSIISLISEPFPSSYEDALKWHGYGSLPWAYDLLTDACYVWFDFF